MFLRSHKRKKNGKEHRYFSIVENHRISNGKTVQRQVLYLGEINDSQQASWRKSLEVFNEDQGHFETLSLFPDDRPVPPDAANTISVKLTEMVLRRPRTFGDCWLGCHLWEQLELSRFWQGRLAEERAEVPWIKVLQLLVVNRLIDPGSEFRIHRQWFLRSAMDELLAVDFAVAGKDRLYRCLDRLLAHKDELCQFLAQRWETLFDTEFDVLLYDLTSTYFEGQCERIPKAKHGYSRDGRGDCRQVLIALVVTTDGLPLAYEVLAGNVRDSSTLQAFLEKIHNLYGKARRIWVMDRGIPTEATLQQMREDDLQYLVGTPRGQLSKMEAELADQPWEQVREQVKVKLTCKDKELYLLAKSKSRQQKEKAIRRRRLKALISGLRDLRERCPDRDKLLQRLGVLKSEAGRVSSLVRIQLPKPDQQVTAEAFSYQLRRDRYRQATTREGSYLLRTNVAGQDGATLWQMYTRLTCIEAAFKTLKSDLAIRPIGHQLESRVEAHILVAFMGYCLMAMLRKRLEAHAPGLTPKAVLEQLASIQMVDVWLPTTDGRWLVMPRYTEPTADQLAVLENLKLQLPQQPPPRIHSEVPVAD